MKKACMYAIALFALAPFVMGCAQETTEPAETPAEEAASSEAAKMTNEPSESTAAVAESPAAETGENKSDGSESKLSGAVQSLANNTVAKADGAAANLMEKLTLANVEAGCGLCTYDMAEAMGCVLAVKVNDKPYLVTGTDVNAHKAGLCDATRTAKLTGAIAEDGTLSASNFEFTDEESHEGHNH